MLILDATTKSLEIVLSGAVTTNQLPVVASYVDVTTSAYAPGSSDTASNNTTAVTVVAAPASSTQRQVKLLTIYNADTVSATVTLRYNDNSTTRVIVKVTLSANDTLVYTDGEGFRVIDTSGEIKTSALASSVADTGVLFTDNTTGNVSTAKHGFVPKSPNDANQFLDGTGAYSVPPGTGAMVRLASQTLSGTAANIDFTSIPATYTHLRLVFQGRSDRAGQVFEGVDVRFNNDSGSNYDSIVDGLNSSTSAIASAETLAGTAGNIGDTLGATGVANTASQFEAVIANYANTTFHKTWHSVGHAKFANSTTNVYNRFNAGTWRSTAAINRITLLPRNGSNFIAGTVVALYGMT